jgi:UDP-N-acetylmuramoyl-tripeptide--D-alanyl-D-alanine ligase
VEEVKAALAEEQPEGYYILIKGSNGIKLFQLPALL